jgi:hypothetical protein
MAGVTDGPHAVTDYAPRPCRTSSVSARNSHMRVGSSEQSGSRCPCATCRCLASTRFPGRCRGTRSGRSQGCGQGRQWPAEIDKARFIPVAVTPSYIFLKGNQVGDRWVLLGRDRGLRLRGLEHPSDAVHAHHPLDPLVVDRLCVGLPDRGDPWLAVGGVQGAMCIVDLLDQETPLPGRADGPRSASPSQS